MIWFDGATLHGDARTTGMPALLDRMRGEYLEMPGLRLTLPQAARLCGLPRDVCEHALTRLVDDGFLRRTGDGAFVREAGWRS